MPVETGPNRIVLPVDAVAQDGVGDLRLPGQRRALRPRPVHVEYRDQQWAVVANDGSLFPGDAVALSAARTRCSWP